MDPAARAPRLAAALARLRDQGERITPAREAVLRVLDESDRADEHLTAEQIGARVSQLTPAVHRATVYRTLTSLTGAGVLSHVHLGGGATVYHLLDTAVEGEPEVQREADHGAERGAGRGAGRGAEGETEPGTAAYGLAHPSHVHVQCDVCGRVLDAPPDALDEVARRLREELGFALDTSHAALLGRCADCS